MERIFLESGTFEDRNGRYYDCPTCGDGNVAEHSNFCSGCGERLVWIESVDAFEAQAKREANQRIEQREKEIFWAAYRKFNPDNLKLSEWMKLHFPGDCIEDFGPRVGGAV